jgi:hypothetical protein
MKEETKPQVGWIATGKNTGIKIEITEMFFDTFEGTVIASGSTMNWVGQCKKWEVEYFTFAPPSPEPIIAEFSDIEKSVYKYTQEDVRRAQQAILCNHRDALQDDDYAVLFLNKEKALNHAKKDIQKQIDEKKREIEELTKKMEEL